MPNVIACYKWVLDETDMRVNQDTLELDTKRAKKKISDYDKNAIEIAVQLTEANGGKTTVLSYGGEDVKQSLQEALSRGAAEAVWVNNPDAGQDDASVIANILSAAVKKIGEYDMIICADASADVSNQQVPARIAALLELPVITSVIKLEIADGKVHVTRRLNDVTETLVVDQTAVYSVLPEIAQPRFPGVKQMMGAKKKPKTEIAAADLGLSVEQMTPKCKVRSIKGYAMTRKNLVFKDASVEEMAAKLAENLARDGLL